MLQMHTLSLFCRWPGTTTRPEATHREALVLHMTVGMHPTTHKVTSTTLPAFAQSQATTTTTTTVAATPKNNLLDDAAKIVASHQSWEFPPSVGALSHHRLVHSLTFAPFGVQPVSAGQRRHRRVGEGAPPWGLSIGNLEWATI